MEARLMVLEHLKIIEHRLGQLKGGIECALPVGETGAMIHREHTLEVIQSIAISVWACKDLVEFELEDNNETAAILGDPQTMEQLRQGTEAAEKGETLPIEKARRRLEEQEDISFARTIIEEADALYGEQPSLTYWIYASRHRPMSGSWVRIKDARFVNNTVITGVHTWLVSPSELDDSTIEGYELDLFCGPVSVGKE